MTNESVNTETIEELKISTIDPNAPAKERKEFPGWLYGILFVVFDAIGVAALQIGVSQSATRVKLSNNMWLTGWGFVTKMFTNLNFVAVLNLILWGVLYVILLMLINRFWIATPIFLAVTFIIAVIEHFKVSIRYEAILPSDLNFLKADAGNLMSFMPAGAQWSRQAFPWRRQAVALAECHRATTADHRAGNVLHAVFHAGEHCRILGENLLFGNGGHAVHVGFRLRCAAQRTDGRLHQAAESESHGEA